MKMKKVGVDVGAHCLDRMHEKAEIHPWEPLSNGSCLFPNLIDRASFEHALLKEIDLVKKMIFDPVSKVSRSYETKNQIAEESQNREQIACLRGAKSIDLTKIKSCKAQGIHRENRRERMAEKWIKSILGIVETGTFRGDAASVNVLSDGAGISYGIFQATEKSGNLWKILFEHYLSSGKNATFAREFESYRKRLHKSGESGRSTLSHDFAFQSLLKRAAKEDPAMRVAQEKMFDQEFFQPAKKLASKHGIAKELGLLVLFDICIQSGTGPRGAPAFVQSFVQQWKKPKHLNKISLNTEEKDAFQKAWIRDLIDYRHHWLQTRVYKDKERQRLVRRTAYRTASYRELAKKGMYDLAQKLLDPEFEFVFRLRMSETYPGKRDSFFKISGARLSF